ncbi:MAG: mechanosensitive ion channel domain-containing protein [Stappiaceae bacterium]
MANRIRRGFRDVLTNAANFPQSASETLNSAGSEEGLGWIGIALVILVVASVVGFFCDRIYRRWAHQHFLYLYNPNPGTRTEKIGYLVTRTIMMTVEIAIFAAAAALVILILDGGDSAVRQTALIGLFSILLVRFLRIVYLNILASDAPAHRMIPLDDETAIGLHRSLMIAISIAAVMFGVCNWMEAFGLEPNAHKLALLGAATFSMLALSTIAVLYRRPIGDIIRGQGSGEASALAGWRNVVANVWHVIAVVYFVFAWAVTAIRLVLNDPFAVGLVVAPLQTLVLAMFLYGLLILAIDKFVLPRLDTMEAATRRSESITAMEAREGEEADEEVTLAQAQAEVISAEEKRSPYRELLDHGATIITVVLALVYLFWSWGLPILKDGSFVGGLTDVVIIAFIAYMAYEAVKIGIDRKIEEESPQEADSEESEMGGKGESRLATLLPIFRNFLLITILSIACMIILSELGVDIAPLFAGAGVIGLAVGFGAQTLIRDIFSGAFFLVDDAFRKGEYIDIGEVKGTVEKISIRSMQLRHHRGVLNTVPFGEIQFVKNYSRDWAIMKLGFRLTYDTDVERVRKMIKKLGQQLLQDPDLGPKFLEPLKSQGVLAMEDSAMIIRVKYTTKPGDQFVLRKTVYAKIRELFEKEGIQFAHREVKVRLADTDKKESDLTPEDKEIIAGAAAPAPEPAGSGANADKL